MKITKKAIFSFVLFAVSLMALNFTAVAPAVADDSLWQGQVGGNDIAQVYGGEGAKQDIRIIVVKIINVALGLLAALFLTLLVIAGFKYMLSGGNETKAKDAISQIKSALIGLIIVMASWAIARYVVIMTGQIMSNKVDYTTYQLY